MGGGGGVTPPQPSAAEQLAQQRQADLLQQQTEILQRQDKEQQLLAPILYKQAGITPTMDDKGNITGFSENPDPNKDLSTSIQTQLLQRQQAALSGQLPIDPTLTRTLDEQQKTLNETFRKQLGPGYQTSSPFITAQDKFNQSKSNLLDSASRGDLTLAEQLGIAQQGSNDATMSNLMSRIMGVGAQGVQTAGAFGQNAQGYNGQLQYFSNDRSQTLNALMANSQAAQAGQSAMIGGGASLAAAGITAAAII